AVRGHRPRRREAPQARDDGLGRRLAARRHRRLAGVARAPAGGAALGRAGGHRRKHPAGDSPRARPDASAGAGRPLQRRRLGAAETRGPLRSLPLDRRARVPLLRRSPRLGLEPPPVQAALVTGERASLSTRLLAIVVAAAMVPTAPHTMVWLLERGVGSRLERIDAALEAVGAEQQGGPNLLPEGGDSVGRAAAAVNRLAQRLRDERGRTRSQIEALETANQKLREAREDLARSERLASVGRLAAGVAHEVGNPVSALIGYAALMRERIAQGRDVAGYSERIEREASRIDRILRDLLELARPPAELQALDLRR